MSASERNPFAVLGFAPRALEGLDDEQILNVARAQHRALSAIHHPDRQGNVERFKVVQEAMAKLNEDFEFQYWKKVFLTPRKDQIRALERQLRETSAKAEGVRARLVTFWLAFARGQEAFRSYGSFGVSQREKAGYHGISVVDPPPVSLVVVDVTRAVIRYHAGVNVSPGDPYGRHEPLFELLVTPSGITKQDLKRVLFDPHEGMPSVRKEWISLSVRTSMSSYLTPSSAPQLLDNQKIIGSFCRETLLKAGIWSSQNQSQERLTADVYTKKEREMHSGWLLHEFERYLVFMEPRIQIGNYVVTVSREGELRFTVLGCVQKIILLEEGEI